MEIGRRIRARRKELDLSLRELADQVGLSASFLSQVERDLVSPSIESLGNISHALGVPIFHFLVEPDRRCPVVRHDQRTKIILPDSDLIYQSLTPDMNRRIGILLIEREPGQGEIDLPLGQDAEVFIYVLEGQAEIQIDEEIYLLGPGDTTYSEGHRLRHFAPRGDRTLRFISVITPSVL
ncbi:MAG: helix-turn-helix domain-containing protein [Anaerolineae bacterium]|jgi:transcriptional regulator with XRE-family HTH domain